MIRPVYRHLAKHSLKIGAICRQSNPCNTVHIDTPAIEVMTDFHLVAPVTVRRNATLSQANNLMVSRSIRLLFVTDCEDVILGVITARDTAGERPIKLIRERGGKHGDLQVEDVMTPHALIEAFTIDDVLRAQVGHILQTLKEVGRQHTIVVETDPLTGCEQVRGIFSATSIGRRLGVPVHTFEVANTFAEIEAALAD